MNVVFDEYFKSVRAQLYERATSPLLGAFTASWIAWNYKFLTVLFSSLPIHDKFIFIEALYPSTNVIISKLAFFPLVSSVLFLFIYPWPARWAFMWWKYHKVKQRKEKQKLEDGDLLSVEQSREIRREILEVENKFDQILQHKDREAESQKILINSQNTQIEKQREQLEQHTAMEIEIVAAENRIEAQANQIKEQADQIGNLKKQLRNANLKTQKNSNVSKATGGGAKRQKPGTQSSISLNEDQISVMKILAKTGGSVQKENVRRDLDMNQIRFDVFIKSLITTNLISIRGSTIYVTDHGKLFLVQNDFV